MMYITLIPTLAITFFDVLFYGALAVFLVAPSLAKALKKAGDAKTQGRSKRTTTIVTRQDMPDANDLARRRRQQIEAMTGKRSGASSIPSASPKSQTDPSNLTMAQRMERSRAKALYEKRAEALRQQSQRANQTARAEPAPPRLDLQEQMARQEQARREKIQRRALQRQQAQAARHKQQQHAAQLAKQRRFQEISITHRLEEQAEHEVGVVHRHVPDAPTFSTVTTHATSTIGPLTVQSLRSAVLFKEILDPPLALRNPDTDVVGL